MDSSLIEQHRLPELRSRLQIEMLASNLQAGLNMTDGMRPIIKQDEESVFLTPKSSPFSPNNGTISYDIPVAFPELTDLDQQHPRSLNASSYINGSPEDTYIQFCGSPPYSPPYGEGSVSSPSSCSVGSLQFSQELSPIPCTSSDQFAPFLPSQPSLQSIPNTSCESLLQPSLQSITNTSCESLLQPSLQSIPITSCASLPNASCINTLAYPQQTQGWPESMMYYNELPVDPAPIMIQDRQMSSSPEQISYYPPSPQPGAAMPPTMCHANMFEGYPTPLNLPYHPPVKIETTARKTKKPRPVRQPIEVDDSEIKDIPSSAQLWEFTLQVLKKPKYNNMVCWENQKEGLFRFHDAQAFAALWGKHRNRPNMTYDKVARALRYYYKRNIFTQVGGRLTYRFSDRLQKLYQSED